MIPVTTLRRKTVAVFGLGASGNATCQALLAGGATVAAWDDNPASRASAETLGIPLVDLSTANWRTFSALILAPGVPLTHPEPHWTVDKAKAARVKVMGDVELFCRERARSCSIAPFIAITGTNGKSTTTALIAHLLRSDGRDVEVGGNIGTPILALEPPATYRIHVIELSSFQIDLAPSLSPTVGVLLNLTPDHLDRHGTMDNYAAIKERLVQAADQACIGIDDEYCRAIVARRQRKGYVHAFTTRADYAEGYHVAGHTLRFDEGPDGIHEQLADLNGIRSLRGLHNAQNALAAVCALGALRAVIASAELSRFLKLDSSLSRGWFETEADFLKRCELRRRGQQLTSPDSANRRRAACQAALASFPGLPHRMEEIGRLGKVALVNDSKATNADSTGKALAAFDHDIFWILGGKPKEGGIASLQGYFPRIAKAYLIGESAEQFAATLDGKVAHERCGTLEAALAAAARDSGACPGAEPVVLLSPACASYDQFNSFEHRGEVFRTLVSAMSGVVLASRGT